MGKDYVAPAPQTNAKWHALSLDAKNDAVPASFIAAEKTELHGPEQPWWMHFHDDLLAQLIEQAEVNNYDLKEAEARILEARANQRQAFAVLLPQVNATASAARQTLDSIQSDKLDDVSQSGFSGSLELDVFGGGRRRLEAARANTEATEAQRDATMLALFAEVGRNYVRLRAAQQLKVLTLENLEGMRGTLAMTEEQRREQVVSDLDVARAQAEVYSAEARLPQIEAAIAAASNRLCVLIGETPGNLDDVLKELQPLPETQAALAVQTPLEVIRARPDVAAAERRLAQTSALTAAAFAQLFPRISLGGFFGQRNSGFFGPLSPWSATASAVMPLLDFGNLGAQIDAANARQAQAYFNYRQTVLSALEEVENNVTATLTEYRRTRLLAASAAQQAKAVEVAREQYKAGEAQQLDLLVAERNRLEAESEVVRSKQQAAENVILLYRSLGTAMIRAPQKSDSATH